MSRLIVILWAASWLWLVGHSAANAELLLAAQESACEPTIAGLDSSIWNTGRGTFLGRAVGQTFLATDTVITRITVWRPPINVNSVANRIFVTAVDTTRDPPWPDTKQILQDGPSVFVRDDNAAPGKPIEMNYIFDPPLILPGPGIYAWFVQREFCDGGETRLIANDSDPYPYGISWITSRSGFGSCVLAATDGGEEATDILFEVEYCGNATTPVDSKTWGRLKVIYR